MRTMGSVSVKNFDRHRFEIKSVIPSGNLAGKAAGILPGGNYRAAMALVRRVGC